MRHLKGEEDKPLPPSKPRKQYKVSKETGKKSRRSKKEKGREQVCDPPGSLPLRQTPPCMSPPIGVAGAEQGGTDKEIWGLEDMGRGPIRMQHPPPDSPFCRRLRRR